MSILRAKARGRLLPGMLSVRARLHFTRIPGNQGRKGKELRTMKVVCTGYENQGICAMCGGQLGKRRRIYCCEECANRYRDFFYWNRAKYEAIERAHHKCQRCGVSAKGLARIYARWYEISFLEVHHIIPLDGELRMWNKLNIGPNLLALCHECHLLMRSHKALAELKQDSSQMALQM